MCGSSETVPETVTIELTLAEWVDTHMAVRDAANFGGDVFTQALNEKLTAKAHELLDTYGADALQEATNRQYAEAGVPVTA